MLHFLGPNTVVSVLVVVLAVACAILYAKVLALRVKSRHNPELVEITTKSEQLAKEKEFLQAELDKLKTNFEELSKSAQEKEVNLSSTTADLKAKMEALSAKIEERENYIQKLSSDHENEVAALKKKAEDELNQVKTESRELLEKTKSENAALLEKTKSESSALLEKTKEEDKALLQATKEEAQSQLEQLKQEANETNRKLSEEHEKTIKKLSEDHDKTLKKLEEQAKASLEDCKEVHKKTLADLKNAHEELLNNTISSSKQTIDKLEKDNRDLKQKLEEMSNTLSEKISKVASLTSEVTTLKTIQENEEKRIAENNKNLENRLNNLGEKLLKERSESLQSANKEHMQIIVNPLQKELATFRELINATQKTSSEQAGQLKNELKNLQQAQVTLEQQAHNLTNALMQGAKTQGMWGELRLEKVLEAAGLVKNETYVRELASTNEEGERGRVDVLVQLPQNQGIIIDSKCSLSAYTQYIAAENEGDEDAANDALKRHITSVYNHIAELKNKDYPSYGEFGSPNFVFMFVPIDQALTIALKNDPTMYDKAQSDNVYLVSPSTLFPALRIVANLWNLAHQGDKFKQLSKSADAIYRKCDKVCRDFEKIKQIRDNFNKQIDAVNTSLCEGRGNLRRLLEVFSYDAPNLTEQAFKNYEHELGIGMQDDNVKAIECSIKPLKTIALAEDSTSSDDANNKISDPQSVVANESDVPLFDEPQLAAAKDTIASTISIEIDGNEAGVIPVEANASEDLANGNSDDLNEDDADDKQHPLHGTD
ncbi:DNA recombination protein RmuC [Anaerobiospirillum succiniciproducens]|uniref:DNA recombination protein RmuC n=1 Tax=Anaerobiospirillum succiniciproducens TaxID=13335 RepID=UPI002942947B|nr:DNA recombination protein RmuC [Anaerobiospirillum succiniciproducens]